MFRSLGYAGFRVCKEKGLQGLGCIGFRELGYIGFRAYSFGFS